MLLNKMYTHCCSRQHLYWASLHRAVSRASPGREGHAVCPQIFPCGRDFPAPYLICCSPIMCHPVPRQWFRCHLLHALPALHPYLLTLQVGGPLSRHPSSVRRLWLGPRRLAWSADHADCLLDISPQAHPIKQTDQGTNVPWSHCGSNDETMPSSAQKRAFWCLPSCPRSPHSFTPYIITITQCLKTSFNTTLNMVG